jgi:hypothetical protein
LEEEWATEYIRELYNSKLWIFDKNHVLTQRKNFYNS